MTKFRSRIWPGQEGQHDDRDDRPEEGEQGGVGVVEEPGDVGQPGRDAHRYRPQPPGEHDAHVPGAPAVLLPHERVEVVRADPGRQQDRQVDHGPAGPPHVEPGVHVLGVGDERRAALRLQRGPPVDRGGPAADGRVRTGRGPPGPPGRTPPGSARRRVSIQVCAGLLRKILRASARSRSPDRPGRAASRRGSPRRGAKSASRMTRYSRWCGRRRSAGCRPSCRRGQSGRRI